MQQIDKNDLNLANYSQQFQMLKYCIIFVLYLSCLSSGKVYEVKPFQNLSVDGWVQVKISTAPTNLLIIEHADFIQVNMVGNFTVLRIISDPPKNQTKSAPKIVYLAIDFPLKRVVASKQASVRVNEQVDMEFLKVQETAVLWAKNHSTITVGVNTDKLQLISQDHSRININKGKVNSLTMSVDSSSSVEISNFNLKYFLKSYIGSGSKILFNGQPIS